MTICGTHFLYKDAANVLAGELEEAAACKAGYSTRDGVLCFGKMATICPALNFELAMNAPSAYFATKKASPRCVEAFKSLVK